MGDLTNMQKSEFSALWDIYELHGCKRSRETNLAGENSSCISQFVSGLFYFHHFKLLI